MPHAMVMCQVLLETERSIEDILRRGRDLKVRVQIVLEVVVVARRAGRVKLFELTDGTHEQQSRKRGQLFSCPWVRGSGCRALIENPTGQRHISSDTSTSTSVRECSRSR